MFTGTLIDELFATVERAESSSQGAEMTDLHPCIELLLAAGHENNSYEPKLLGVA